MLHIIKPNLLPIRLCSPAAVLMRVKLIPALLPVSLQIFAALSHTATSKG